MTTYLIEVDLSDGGATPSYQVLTDGRKEEPANAMPDAMWHGDLLKFSVRLPPGTLKPQEGRKLLSMTHYYRKAHHNVLALTPFTGVAYDAHTSLFDPATDLRVDDVYACKAQLAIDRWGGMWYCSVLGTYRNKANTITPFLFDFACRVPASAVA